MKVPRIWFVFMGLTLCVILISTVIELDPGKRNSVEPPSVFYIYIGPPEDASDYELDDVDYIQEHVRGNYIWWKVEYQGQSTNIRWRPYEPGEGQ